MYRVLHTADWHIDAQPAYLQEKKQEYKNRRYRTAEGIADRARRDRVNAVLIAGDLFDRWEIRDPVLSRTIEILERFAPVPVYIIPGNHDPLSPDGVWDSRLWRTAGDHVHLCLSNSAEEIAPNVVLYPCPLTGRSSSEDPTCGIPVRDEGDSRIRIGLAHGSIQHREEYDEIPIDPGRATKTGLTYLALGHWHSPFASGRAMYPGGIEPTRFGEPVGKFTIAEFGDGIQEPVTEHCECGKFCWYDGAPEISTVDDVRVLRDSVTALMAEYDLVLRVTPDVSRVEDPSVLDELDRLREYWHERAFFNGWEYDDFRRVLLTGPDSVPAGILRTAWQNLERMLNDEATGRDPEVVRAALVELQRITQEAAR